MCCKVLQYTVRCELMVLRISTTYHGQYSTYEKLGFQLIDNSKIGLIVRKFFYC